MTDPELFVINEFDCIWPFFMWNTERVINCTWINWFYKNNTKHHFHLLPGFWERLFYRVYRGFSQAELHLSVFANFELQYYNIFTLVLNTICYRFLTGGLLTPKGYVDRVLGVRAGWKQMVIFRAVPRHICASGRIQKGAPVYWIIPLGIEIEQSLVVVLFIIKSAKTM